MILLYLTFLLLILRSKPVSQPFTLRSAYIYVHYKINHTSKVMNVIDTTRCSLICSIYQLLTCLERCALGKRFHRLKRVNCNIRYLSKRKLTKYAHSHSTLKSFSMLLSCVSTSATTGLPLTHTISGRNRVMLSVKALANIRTTLTVCTLYPLHYITWL